MALALSNPADIGKKAPDFELLDTVSDQKLSLNSLKGENGTAIFFICNHCPYVIHINHELVRLANDYLNKGIAFIAISSNDINNYPQDAPEYMKRLAEQLKYPFPYLYDESQEVAHTYQAVCTPDLYLFDADLKMVYHGQLDGSRPGNNKAVNGKDLRNAINALINGQEPLENQLPSSGCSIKWK